MIDYDKLIFWIYVSAWPYLCVSKAYHCLQSESNSRRVVQGQVTSCYAHWKLTPSIFLKPWDSVCFRKTWQWMVIHENSVNVSTLKWVIKNFAKKPRSDDFLGTRTREQALNDSSRSWYFVWSTWFDTWSCPVLGAAFLMEAMQELFMICACQRYEKRQGNDRVKDLPPRNLT